MVRWGILSTARINRRLIPAIRASARSELLAVASRDEGRASSYAKLWGIPYAFGSYETMLESDILDAIYISLPNHLHAEWTVKALRTGKHVLCEKPLALRVEEVDQMIAASETAGCILAEAFMYRHHPQTKILGEWVKSGRLGEVTMIRGVFNFYLSDRKNNIRLDPKMGGGSLWDVGVYPLSLAQYVMGGPPEWVMGDQWIGQTGVDETFIGQLHYGGCCLAQIASSIRSPFYTHAEIMGTEGVISLNRPFIDLEQEGKFVFQPSEGEPEIVHIPEKELYLGEIEDMNAAILDGTPTSLSLTESRDHIRTVTALYESAQKHEIIHLQ
jgi:xylose dehydrogenase (NAD/NADP)